MKNIVYARFNRQRLPQFQLATFILADETQRVIIKQALTPAARAHLRQIRQAHQLLAQARSHNNVYIPALIEKHTTDDRLAIEYIDAPSIDQTLYQCLRQNHVAAFWKVLDQYQKLIATAFGATNQPVNSEAIRAIFGDAVSNRLLTDTTLAPYTNIACMDPIFANILVQSDTHSFIDNEWVWDGTLPIKFLIYRALFYFFKAKYLSFNFERVLPWETVLTHCQISADDAALYAAMDALFQDYVFGTERNCAYSNRYLQPAHNSLAAMQQTIAKQRAEIQAMRETAGWRLLEKARRHYDRCAPLSSRRRRSIQKILTYWAREK